MLTRTLLHADANSRVSAVLRVGDAEAECREVLLVALEQRLLRLLNDIPSPTSISISSNLQNGCSCEGRKVRAPRIFGPSWPESHPQEPLYVRTLLPAAGPMDYPLPGYSRNPV